MEGETTLSMMPVVWTIHNREDRDREMKEQVG